MVMHRYTATCPAGVGVYLVQELTALGAVDVVERPIGVQLAISDWLPDMPMESTCQSLDY